VSLSARHAGVVERERELTDTAHKTTAALEAGLEHVRAAPPDVGRLELIVRRPAVDEREVLDIAELSHDEGVVGDTWRVRGSSRTEDGGAHPEMQLNVMNARAAQLVAGHEDRWALAGDQLYLDFDISEENLPAGTRLALGDAVIEITDQPHTGCHKFAARFGKDALRFVNSPVGKQLRLRGMNARVVVPGRITRGVEVRKLPVQG
jgi:hypothetical protein